MVSERRAANSKHVFSFASSCKLVSLGVLIKLVVKVHLSGKDFVTQKKLFSITDLVTSHIFRSVSTEHIQFVSILLSSIGVSQETFKSAKYPPDASGGPSGPLAEKGSISQGSPHTRSLTKQSSGCPKPVLPAKDGKEWCIVRNELCQLFFATWTSNGKLLAGAVFNGCWSIATVFTKPKAAGRWLRVCPLKTTPGKKQIAKDFCGQHDTSTHTPTQVPRLKLPQTSYYHQHPRSKVHRAQTFDRQKQARRGLNAHAAPCNGTSTQAPPAPRLHTLPILDARTPIALAIWGSFGTMIFFNL